MVKCHFLNWKRSLLDWIMSINTNHFFFFFIPNSYSNTTKMNALLLSFPSEIITQVFSYLTIKDLARIECTCKLLQSFSLSEMERRIIREESSNDKWGILVKVNKMAILQQSH